MTSTLYWDDCLNVLPYIEPVDAVITDPIWPNVPPGMFEATEKMTPSYLLHEALVKIQAKRVIIVLRYDSDPRFLSAVPSRWPFFRVQTLGYSVPGYNGRKLGGMELAYCFGEPVPSAPGRRVIPGQGPTVQPLKHLADHPCPRNVNHFRWLVNWWTDPGETVLDPFMGSGVTGQACVQMQRNFIGIEIVGEYYELAKKQIEVEQERLHLFTEAQ